MKKSIGGKDYSHVSISWHYTNLGMCIEYVGT